MFSWTLISALKIYFQVMKLTLAHCDHIHKAYLSRGVRGIFFRGGQSHFSCFFPGVKCFFPVENSHLVDPKQISVVFKSEKKEKRSSPHFLTFRPSIFNLHLPFFDFPSFLLYFPFFPCLSFSGRVSRNFTVRSRGGGGIRYCILEQHF